MRTRVQQRVATHKARKAKGREQHQLQVELSAHRRGRWVARGGYTGRFRA